ncbi:hypothetical protein KBC03_01640 [Patescibacteria group bacterium]|nr:hypothetical protein [Patescibacteria group bacterium]
MTDGKGKPLKSENGGTGYRIREIRDNHHFAKPTYYEKLVAMKKNNESEYKNVA